MATGSLLALLDDIATILDDVALMTKVAAKKSAAMADDVSVMTKVAAQKTAGVLGDDLALNAQQVTGVRAEREIPVVWAVAKGSMINKVILVPAALLISAFAPWAVTPLLMVGGAFLCFEGFEKVAHKLLHAQHQDEADHHQAGEQPGGDAGGSGASPRVGQCGDGEQQQGDGTDHLSFLIRSIWLMTSVKRMPNLSFTTTTSPWAIRVPLTSTSRGSPATRSSSTTEP